MSYSSPLMVSTRSVASSYGMWLCFTSHVWGVNVAAVINAAVFNNVAAAIYALITVGFGFFAGVFKTVSVYPKHKIYYLANSS